jgi:hypothetical protein
MSALSRWRSAGRAAAALALVASVGGPARAEPTAAADDAKPACEVAAAPPACRTSYDAEKVVVFSTTTHGQMGETILLPHFKVGGVEITRRAFAARFRQETGSDEIEHYRVANMYPFTVAAYIAGGVGLVATAVGAPLWAATKDGSGAHTAGEVTTVVGLALLAPTPVMIIGGASREDAGYSFDEPTAQALVARYDRALWRRLAASCCPGAAASDAGGGDRRDARAPLAREPARSPGVRVSPLVGPLLGVRVRF